MKCWLIGYFILLVITVLGQFTEEEPPSNSQSQLFSLSTSGHGYPVTAIGNIHKSFMVLYVISRDTQLELQGFSDTYLITERIRTRLGGKVHLNDTLYVLSGMEVETDTGNYNRALSLYRLVFVAGAGYDVSENLMIELKGNVQMNNANNGVCRDSLIEMPAGYTIGSKLNFYSLFLG